MAGLVTAEKLVIANPADTYGYAAEQRALAASIRSVVQVANRAEADTIATAMATDGRAVSDTNPLYVYRLDYQRLEVKTAAGWGGPAQGVIQTTDYAVQSGGIAAKAIVMNIPTVTFVAGRTYRLHAEGNYYQNSTGSTFVYGIASCPVGDPASQTSGLIGICSQADSANAANEGRRFNISCLYKPATTGPLQLKFTAERVTGSAVTYVSGAADNVVQMYVEDMGIVPPLA